MNLERGTDLRPPVSPGATTSAPRILDGSALASALHDELAAARDLVASGRALISEMRAGGHPQQIEPLVLRYASSLDAMKAAAKARADYLSGAGELERWIAAYRPKNAAQLSAIAEEARQLKEQIRRDAEQAGYLARRVAGWYEAQRAWIVEMVAREVEPTGYGASSRSGLASAIDRSA